MSFVVDASIYVAAALLGDVHNTDSHSFLKRIDLDDESVYCPSIVLRECAGAIARPTRDSALGKGTATLLLANTHITIAEATVQRAREAADIAANHFLRGADSLYVQVAKEYSATLMTWDSEMLQRAPAIVSTMTPTEWLAANP